MFSSCPALAQQPPTEYNIKVNQDELNLISEGLQQEPFGKVLPLINKLRSQFLEQQPKPEQKPAAQPDKNNASPQDK